MSAAVERAKQFLDAFGQARRLTPGFPSQADAELRVRLLAEEFEEYVQAVEDGDLEGIADALADMRYVIYGTDQVYGFPTDAIDSVVHAANMAKAGPDGKAIFDGDGKVRKPEGWLPPDIAAVLDAARRVG